MDFVVVRTKMNKKKIVIFFVCLGLDLYIQKIILQKRNVILQETKRNETERYFFWNRNQKPKNNVF
jgi:hypothetical protein